jgi:septum formation protein
MKVANEPKRFMLTITDAIKLEILGLLGSTPVTLASGSPRRREILALAGIGARVVVPSVDETAPLNCEPAQFALDLAHLKLSSVAGEAGITIAADTIVVLDNQILGKPLNKADAARILRLLSGRCHYVITALALRDELTGRIVVGYEQSYVTFQQLASDDIESYIDSGEPMDKAGAYGIQGMGELLVERLDGSLHNVIGFPIDLFLRLIRELRS